jgi:hypothetical protein
MTSWVRACFERVLFGRRCLFQIEELRGLEAREAAPEIYIGYAGHGLQKGNGHVLADDGRNLKELLLLVRQTIEARLQDALNGVGHRDVRAQVRMVGHSAGQFLQKEGHALGPGDDRLRQLGRQLLADDGMNDFEAIGRRETVERDLGGIGPSEPRWPIARTIRGDEHDRATREALGKRSQRIFRV